jgi:hypothetical protein
MDSVKTIAENDKILVNECLYPKSPQPSVVTGKIQQQSFWMISKILDNNESSENQTCGLIEVANWGSLLPVSSRITGYVYKNIHCSREHGVKDENVVIWNGAMVCDTKRKNFELTETFVNTCHVQFFAPRGILIHRSSVCFNDLIDTCSGDVFNIPESIPMNKTEVKNACTSGFLSPYRTDNMYANIFCHICNGHLKASPFKCRDHSQNIFKTFGGNSISGLINYKYLQKVGHARTKKGYAFKPTMACLRKDGGVFESVYINFFLMSIHNMIYDMIRYNMQ